MNQFGKKIKLNRLNTTCPHILTLSRGKKRPEAFSVTTSQDWSEKSPGHKL